MLEKLRQPIAADLQRFMERLGGYGVRRELGSALKTRA